MYPINIIKLGDITVRNFKLFVNKGPTGLKPLTFSKTVRKVYMHATSVFVEFLQHSAPRQFCKKLKLFSPRKSTFL